IGATPKEKTARAPQPIKVIDPKKPGGVSGASLIESATTIGANTKKEEMGLKESFKKEVEKLQKDTDPIIDRYNPYSETSEPGTPRPPSPTPWLASNFSIVKGDFQESKQGEAGTTSGLSDEQVKDIIEKIKGEHKRKST
ncbi:MAG: hypothetical protein FD167_5219, partial [bacterium]